MRILLYIGMQIAVLVMVSIVGSVLLSILGVSVDGQSSIGLLIMCACYGCIGSFISLFASKWMCKRSYKIQLITSPVNSQQRLVYDTVYKLSQQAGFKMPEVGIYQSQDPNAFATGATRDSALVAVSTGLLNSMSADEIRGVLGHEITHIKNGDMVTMSLLQGVLNTFVYFFSFIIAQAAANAGRDNRRGNTFVFYAVNSICQMIFGLLATIILMAFSRWREYRADAGSASLTGTGCMVGALEALKRGVQPSSEMKSSMAAMCINGPKEVMSELFLSHPPLDKRIAALKAMPR